MKMKRIWFHVLEELKFRKKSIIFLALLWTVHQLACNIAFENEGLNRLIMYFQLLPFVGILFIIGKMRGFHYTDPPALSSTAASSLSLSPGEKDTAKSLFILIFISGPILFLQIFFMVLKGASLADIFSAIPTMILFSILFIPYWLFAVLFPISSAYIWVSMLYIFIPGIFLTNLQFHIIHIKSFLFDTKPFIPTSIEILQCHQTSLWLTALLCGGIILYQYLTRKTKSSIILSIVAFLVIITLSIVWPLDLFKGVEEVKSISLTDLRIQDFSVHSMSNRSGYRKRWQHKQYNLGVKKFHSLNFINNYDGIPDNFLLKFKTVRNIKIQFPNEIFTAPSVAIQGGSHNYCKFRALHTIFSPSQILCESYKYQTKRLDYMIIGIPDDIFRKLSAMGGVVTGDVKLRLSQYNIAAVLPLEVGKRAQKGAEYIEITNIQTKGRGYIVNTKIQAKDFRYFPKRRSTPVSRRDYFVWEDMVIVLHNKIRQEIITLNMQSFVLEPMINIKERKKQKLKQGSPLFTIMLPLSFNGDYHYGDLSNYFPKIDDEWLKHAELVILEEEDVGEAILPLRLENLVFLKEHELSTEKRVEPLRNITLQKYASPTEVREYILRMLVYADAQVNYPPINKIVEKITRIGTEHIPLLAKLGKQYFSKYYVQLAIEKMAGPENKDQIIDILESYPDLISVVIREGWQAEAQPILIKRLERNINCNWLPQWVKAGISLNDKTLYPILKRRLLDSSYSVELYSLIKDLPGIELSDIMPRFWKQLKYNTKLYLEDSLAESLHIGLEWGYADAFDVAIYFLEHPNCKGSTKKIILGTLKQHLQYNGPDKDLHLWLKENREKLEFIPETQTFGLPNSESIM